jgi:hypothetical protein
MPRPAALPAFLRPLPTFFAALLILQASRIGATSGEGETVFSISIFMTAGARLTLAWADNCAETSVADIMVAVATINTDLWIIVFFLGFWLPRVCLAGEPTMSCRCIALCKLHHSSQYFLSASFGQLGIRQRQTESRSRKFKQTANWHHNRAERSSADQCEQLPALRSVAAYIRRACQARHRD